MVTVRNRQGRSFVFTLADDTSFRIASKEEKQITKSQVSAELHRAAEMDLIDLFEEAPKKDVVKQVTQQEPPKKKSKFNQEV